MEPLHISEGDLAKDVRSILKRVESGEDVTITDETGSLLWPSADATTGGGPGASTKLQAEQTYDSRVSAHGSTSGRAGTRPPAW